MRNKVIYNKDQLYRNLFLYKSFLYKNVEFKTDIKDEEAKSIITVLNIKKRNERIDYIYNYVCEKIDKFYEGKNICGFSNNQCLNQQIDGCTNMNGCCRFCIYQTSKGCSTSNLSCKLFYCDLVKKSNEIIRYKDLKILKLLSIRQRLIARDNFFTTKKDFILELKVGLVTFYAVRVLIRMIKNSIGLRKLRKDGKIA